MAYEVVTTYDYFVGRVFILLAALSQRSLMGPSAAGIVESILTMLTRLLSPLNADRHSHHHHSRRGMYVTDRFSTVCSISGMCRTV